MLLTADWWYERPIIYDNKKYYCENNENSSKIIEKKTNTIVLEVSYPVFVKQISYNEFITVDKSSNKDPCQFLYIFSHLQYDEEKKTTKIIYEKEYASKKPLGEIDRVDNIFIMDTFLDITIYNPEKRKSLTLKNTEFSEKLYQESGRKYLKVEREIKNKDYLTMLVDIDTLESNGFYSRLQNRFIPIIQDDNHDFKKNYKSTVKQEVKKYIELLNLIEQEYVKQCNQKAEQVLKKRLTKKK